MKANWRDAVAFVYLAVVVPLVTLLAWTTAADLLTESNDISNALGWCVYVLGIVHFSAAIYVCGPRTVNLFRSMYANDR